MWKDKESKRYIIGFVSAFVLFAIIRHATYPIEATHEKPYYLYMISQIGCTLIVSCWMLTVNSRIINRRIRRLMLLSGAMFLVYFGLQMVKYCLFTEERTVGRYMWYGYYIPMTLIPLIVLFILQYLGNPEEKPMNRMRWILLTVALLICIGFMTNDIHRLAFDFPGGIELGDENRTLEPLYFIYIAFMAVLAVLAVLSIVRNRHKIENKQKLIYPAIPIAIGIIYILIYAVKPELIRIGKHQFFELAEAFALMMIGFLEACVQVGLIPSNMGYNRLFSLTGIPARIADGNGRTVLSTQGADNIPEATDDYRIVQVPVTGGKFIYSIDLSVLNRLNRQLEETIVNLNARNELLRHENEIIEDKEKSDAAIRIYDRISEYVQPQTTAIREILADECNEEQFRKNLARCAMLNAYIKRRSNMELEAEKNGYLPFKELVTAVAESLEYIKLSGTETFISATGDGICPPEPIRRAYIAFEQIVENVLESVDYMTVRIILDDTVNIRFLMSKRAGMPDFTLCRPEGCESGYSVDGNDVEYWLLIHLGGESIGNLY